ncbi:MAG: hypothetical protein FJX47_03460 [Alphaproteobacteria bacterium]|nr:hypothetical protein [Alphaproteobacteria bacterium]
MELGDVINILGTLTLLLYILPGAARFPDTIRRWCERAAIACFVLALGTALVAAIQYFAN